MTLASLLDPLEGCISCANKGELPKLKDVVDALSRQIEKLIKPILSKYAKQSSQADERWYWAALTLLDRQYFRGPVLQWLENESDKMAWRSMVQGRGGDEDSNFADHVDLFCEHFKGKHSLGKPPDDLIEVLTKIATASPAVVALRALLRFSRQSDPGKISTPLLAAAARIALGFRSLFNTPDAITMLRGLQTAENSRYWETVLDYCVGGNLQSVMDEYVHILREALGLANVSVDSALMELAEEIHRAVSIRTVNLEFDEIKLQSNSKSIELARHSMRCRFALRFGDGKNEEDGSETRADHVRSAFNSPFRPFILASTSVGQEGLDFHQYCHNIYHWNLPSNPVDLEQREGRIHRYKGHAIRRNVAKAFALSALKGKLSRLSDPWDSLFSLALESRRPGLNDLIPFWIFETKGGHKICRHVPALPLSSETEHLKSLLKSLAAYRMVFGQPRQEDLLNYLESRLERDIDVEELLKYRIDLSPPGS